VPRLQGLEPEDVDQGVHVESAGQVLLVRHHQQRGPRKALLLQQGVQLRAAVLQPEAVRRIDDPYEPVSLLEIIAPIRSNRFLPTDVPQVELVTLELDCTDIEATSITDTSGYLVSSNYETGNTGLYSSGDNCQWHIQDFPGQVIKLSFPEFDVEKGWDYVYVYDGDSILSPLLAKLSGSKSADTFSSDDGIYGLNGNGNVISSSNDIS